LTHTST